MQIQRFPGREIGFGWVSIADKEQLVILWKAGRLVSTNVST